MTLWLTKWGSPKPVASPQIDVLDSNLVLDKSHAFRIALLIPMCGSAGLWGPSCIASAQVAVNELNRTAGIGGRKIQLIMIDSAIEAQTPVGELVNSLIETGSIDAIVGMHISAVRQQLSKVVRGRIPFVYTPLYEGGEHTPGIFTIGAIPSFQLGPAMEYLQGTYKLKRWAFIGNDYVWPRASNTYAKSKLAAMGSQLVYEQYLPFGAGNLTDQVEKIANSNADAVLISLVGQDAVDFNRIFGFYGLDSNMIRLSCAIEENGLLASGAENVKRLFSAASYFGGIDTPENACFKEKYHGLHGVGAPMLNTLGQSTYEGIQFLASLIGDGKSDWRRLRFSPRNPIEYASVRCAKFGSNSDSGAPIYLARASGVLFESIIKIL